jgi:hypothetical protein
MTWRAMSGTDSASSGTTGRSGRAGPAGRAGPPGRTGPPGSLPLDARSPDALAPEARSPDDGPRTQENQGWSIFSYLIAGMVAYGLIGWLLAWLTHIPMLTAAGTLVGLVFAIGGIVWKYGRHP